ncbi:hypothetical protein HY949_02630 [Candidatus Gottesmanbacteria bacterium]|nr:hypothetical protein [Candidatus Gottesmanbacteria bacterium]
MNIVGLKEGDSIRIEPGQRVGTTAAGDGDMYLVEPPGFDATVIAEFPDADAVLVEADALTSGGLPMTEQYYVYHG